MTRRVHVASPLAPFKYLVRLIEENRVSAIPIVDQQGIPVGIVSESDLLFKDAARLMQERNVRRLVVVDARGRIAGIVSRSDLLQVFLRTDEELREEIAGTLIPALILSSPESVGVEVRWNMVTLSGEVDRKSDADILTRLTRQIDGVVDVVDNLSYRWDDTVAAPVCPVSLERSVRAY